MVVEIIIICVVEILCLPLQGICHSYIQEKCSRKSSAKNARAVQITSSTISFGNNCQRFVDKAFQESEKNPSTMGICADVRRSLHKQITKRYPDVHFHIVIGEKHSLDLAVAPTKLFAEIERDQYRVLISSNKENFSANGQMKLK